MKRILIAVAIATSVTVAQAASYDWKTSALGKVYGAGSETLLASGTAYIFDIASVSQQSVLTAFMGDGSIATGSLDNKTIASGVISKTTATGGAAFSLGKTSWDAFVVIVNGDSIFISDAVTVSGADVGTSTIQFKLADQSQASAFDSATFSKGGWYNTGSVPEPTSGILLLLGVAGLALKRKRA